MWARPGRRSARASRACRDPRRAARAPASPPARSRPAVEAFERDESTLPHDFARLRLAGAGSAGLGSLTRRGSGSRRGRDRACGARAHRPSVARRSLYERRAARRAVSTPLTGPGSAGSGRRAGPRFAAGIKRGETRGWLPPGPDFERSARFLAGNPPDELQADQAGRDRDRPDERDKQHVVRNMPPSASWIAGEPAMLFPA